MTEQPAGGAVTPSGPSERVLRLRRMRRIALSWPPTLAIAVGLVIVAVWAPTAAAWISVAVIAAVSILGLISLTEGSRRLVARTNRRYTELTQQLQQLLPESTQAPEVVEEPAAEPVEDPPVWSREAVLGDRFTQRGLSEFTSPTEPVAWQTRNPYLGRTKDELLELLQAEIEWRYHHGIPEIEQTTDYYTAYAERVDAMHEMLDHALTIAGVDVGSSSFVDLGAAEGYVTNHLLDAGAADVDAVELNQTNIRKMWLVRAFKGQERGRIGTLDLERADWSAGLGRSYDVALALGVIYHMENPNLFARNLFACTDSVAVVESDTPNFDANQRFRGHGIAYLHRDQVTLSQGNIRYLSEMRPDRRALAEILLNAGFATVHVVPPATESPCKYFDTGEKTLVVAIKEG